MKKRFISITLAMVSALLLSSSNEGYAQNPESGFTINIDDEQLRFGSDFYVLFREDNPQMELRDIPEGRYFAPTWLVPEKFADQRTILKDETSGGDGIDDSMSTSLVSRSYNYYHSGAISKFKSCGFHMEGETMYLEYPELEIGTLEAKAVKVADNQWKLTYHFKAAKNGYYSILYMGAPSLTKDNIDYIFQPMVWQQKRFPVLPYVSLAYCCSVPASFVYSEGKSWGVVVSPDEFPFNPLPTRENNRFGVMTKDDQGTYRPMVVAPVMGGLDSYMISGDNYDFNFRLYAKEEEPTYFYESISREIYGFEDYRENSICNLNETLDNMQEYALSEYSCFIDSLKGCSYSTDVLGSVNNSNSLNPISISLISDSKDFFLKRAVPVTEYMMSRGKALFCLDTTMKIQSPTRAMGGPCSTLNELAGLHYFSQSDDSYFMDHVDAGRYRNGQYWGAFVDLYRATGDKKYLAKAIKEADKYIEVTLPEQSHHLEKKGFWNTYSPDFKYLLELYECCGEKRFLEAAHKGARMYAMYIWMCPMIPDQEVLVNEGGKAPHYWYLKGKGFPQMEAKERYINAWNLSEIGLLPESSFTSIGHRAVFMAHHAPYMMRIAHYTGDGFLKDIARSAIVGRYRNFPGYHINTTRTDIYMQEDYPLHKWNELSVNSFHYNHIMPMISLLFDYLVTDFWYKSNEQISFPSFHTEAHAYLQEKVYGNRPGTFYDHENVYLWIPKHVLKDVDTELNYLMARDRNNLYLSFSNQSKAGVRSHVGFDQNRIKIDPSKTYEVEVIDADGKTHAATMKNARLDVEVPASGMLSFVIKDVETVVEIQDKFADKSGNWAKNGYVEGRYSGSHAYVIDFGKELKEAYAYIDDDDFKVRKVTFTFNENGKTSSYTDCHYPFEYTAPVCDQTSKVDVTIRIEYLDGKIRSEKLRLRK